ncbi:MAG: DNA polymerase III subunit gamma/tau [Defluviitaleaceae bacterium]|nr:DNA polymerase III subunit gamma/tau [Defluviitaleaceae bacterium]
MSYLALYRKLRPSRFADVVGQEHVVTTLQNQVSSRRIAHAYLFVGTRGTGKTTMAKIFARAINCVSPEGGEACGKCAACLTSQGGASPNILEIDAASNNSVDNIRELREEIRHAPISGTYKVLIIDEVHMLSTGAFNALLKTLEEPPAHVFFILATTEVQKIPATILSRCQRFDFKRISPREMTAALRKYMDSEGIDITDDALDYVAALSDGAMRDALSLLDRAAALYQDVAITRENLRELTGAVDEEVYLNLTNALQSFDSRNCLELIDEAVMNGRDVTQFVHEYVRYLRDLMLKVSMGGPPRQADYSAERILRLLTRFVELSSQLRYSGNERISLEVACIRLCSPENAGSEDSGEILARLAKLEQGHPIRQDAPDVPTASQPAPASKADSQGIPAQATRQSSAQTAPKPDYPASEPTPDDIKAAIKNFGALADRMRMPVKRMLKSSSPRYAGGGYLTIVTDDGNISTLERSKDKIKSELAVMFKKDIDVVIVPAGTWGGDGKRQAGNSVKDSRETFAEVFGDDIVEYS